MKKIKNWGILLLTVLLCMTSTSTLAHDFAVTNDDGVTIYYVFTKFKEVAISYQGRNNSSYSNEYTGNVVIPESVAYNGTVYAVTSINEYAFYNCTTLESVTIPNTVTNIDNNAFLRCPALTSVTLPNSVTSIGDYAFSECSSLTSITIPNSVTSIGSWAFQSCSNLTSLTLPNSVTSIGDHAFTHCSSLANITLSSSLNSIRDGMFEGCSSLASVNIPNSVSSIGDYALSNCSSLTSVSIPNSVTSIGFGAFSGCTALANITIPNSVTIIYSDTFDGTAWYDNQPEGLIYVGKVAYKYKGNLSETTSIEIKEGTVSISPWAFSKCTNLANVTIPNSVTYIGNSAFDGTYWYNNQPGGLVYVGKIAYKYKGTMPANTNIVIKNGTIGISPYAFSNCYGLTSITIPNSVTNIGSGAFSSCSALSNIVLPNSVTSIDSYAFQSCSSLTSVTLPNSVTSISNGAFQYCSSLSSIVLPNSVTSIDSWAFQYCSSLTSVTISSSVTSIGNNAFENCSSLKSITIPNSVTSIGISAFGYCSNLTSVTMPSSVTKIDDSAFYDCVALTSITIPNTVTHIGNYAFYGSSLKNVYCLPEEAPYIGNYIFNSSPYIFVTESAQPLYEFSRWRSYIVRSTEPEAIELGGLYYYLGALSDFAEITQNPNGYGDEANLEIPEKITYKDKEYRVKYIGEYAFSGWESLIFLKIPSSIVSIGNSAFNNCNSLFSVTIPDNVTSIGDCAFAGCSGINNINISDGVTSIGYSAFRECSGLVSVTIPNSVLTINDGAFERCTSLISVTLPSGITSIQPGTFSRCESLVSVTIPEGVTSLKSESGYSGNYGCFSYCKSLVNVELPKSLTTIENSIFSGCSNLTNITIPDNVLSIGDDAFSWCSSLKSVTLPNKVTYIGNNAFGRCGSLTSVTIPNSVSSISDNTFQECWGLTSVAIPNSVISIGNGAFNGCSNLPSITIPGSVTTIGNYAFSGCSSLASIEIPNSVSAIGEYAFRDCSAIQSLKLSDGLKAIKKGTFRQCASLKQLTIPASVEYIYQEAFAYCYSLESVKVLSTTPPFLFDNSFSDYNIPLIVPQDCVSTYSSAQGWKNFSSISEERYKLIYILDGEEYRTYLLAVGATIAPESYPEKEGYTFSGWSDIPETMPANDVTVTGTFTVNKYKLIYTVDGEEYKSSEVEYGSTITAETEPTKEGYSFSGWSEIPETMPAKDVTVTGTFTVNKYKLTYSVDGEEYKSYDVEYGSTITSETEPTKEGYTFSGWSDIPETMPAKDVNVTGAFTVNKYKLTYSVDGEEYKSYDVEYGSTITSETEPTKEGYTFSGWSDLPETMPAKDVTVTGTFTINKYKVTYMIDGEVYQTVEVEYGSTITPPNPGDREGYNFAWGDYPSTMPAENITINGSYTATDIRAIMADESDVKIFNVSGKPLNNLQKGVNILRYKDGRTQKLIIK